MIRALLTIDDVSSKNTPAIVDYLHEKGIRALMFAWGQNVERHWDEALYALRGGMIVGNHSHTHPAFSQLSFEAGVEEIERCEALLEDLYRAAGIERKYRPFRFPYGDKGGANRAAFQRYLAERGFDKVDDGAIFWPWWRENGLDRDIDTFWTFDFAEYNLRPGSGFTEADVWRRIDDPEPKSGAPLFEEGGNHILLLHAHDETETMLPGYYRRFIDRLLERGVTFVEPTFVERPPRKARKAHSAIKQTTQEAPMLEYRRMTEADIEEYIALRIRQLREEGATEDVDLVPALTDYYARHLSDGTFAAWLALDGGRIVATSGMTLAQKPPYFSNPTGKIGLLSGMYTAPEYRRRGIGRHLLGKVVDEARAWGCGAVHITASDAGVLLYTAFGFEKNGNFMQYKL